MNGTLQIQQEPRVAFRVDASTEIGTGHVMRCLTLADALSGLGARSEFICRPHDGHLIGEIEKRGYHVVVLPTLALENETLETPNVHAHWLGTSAARDAEDTINALGTTVPDWLIVDHYGLDARWENVVRPHCAQILVIDDLADRAHACDVLLDHGLEHSKTSYAGWVSSQTQVVCGPQYALLRPEFAEKRDGSLARRKNPTLRHILVSMGGVDKENATGQVLAALSESEIAMLVELTVVMGPQAPWLDKVRSFAATLPGHVRVLAGTTRMAELMHDADLAIGAAGTTSWERCCLGLPSVVLVLAANQTGVAASLESAGAAICAANPSDFPEVFRHNLSALMSPDTLADMSANAARITAGHGANQIAALLMAGLSIRPSAAASGRTGTIGTALEQAASE